MTRQRQIIRKSLRYTGTIIGACVIAVAINATSGVPHELISAARADVHRAKTPSVRTLSAKDWAPFGVTYLRADSTGIHVGPQPGQYSYMWYGVYLASTGLCDYAFNVDAAVQGPTIPTLSGYGYAPTLRASVTNDVPSGSSVQYDPPFGGYRFLDLPDQADQPGHNAFQAPMNQQFNHWTIIVKGRKATIYLGSSASATSLIRHLDLGSTCGGGIVLRVWNSELTFRNATLSKI